MNDTPVQIQNQFRTLCDSLVGVELSHLWRGYGSTILLEFGKLTPHYCRDGSEGNPRGQFGLHIDWSWRIEGKRRIWCGSWSDEEHWQWAFARLLRQRISSISLFGRLPEIDVTLSDGLHVVSYMTAEGDPRWSLNDRTANRSFRIVAGRLWVEPYSKPQT